MNAMSESGSMEFDIFENEAYVNIRHWRCLYMLSHSLLLRVITAKN